MKILILLLIINISIADWLEPQRLTDELGRSETTWPSNAHCIACDGNGRVYVIYTCDAWTDTSEIYIKISTDYGITWLPEQQITDAVNERCYPSIVLDTLNRVHAVWMDKRDGVGWQVYYKRSTDEGSTWDSDIRISLDDDYSQSPSVATDGADEVYVVWFDSVAFENHDIFFRKSANGGVNWGSEIRISTGSSVEDYPTIAYEPLDKIHIAWPDLRNGSMVENNHDIWYRRSTDRGLTWGPQTELIADTLGQIMCSIAATSSGYVHLTWTDARDSEFLVFRKEIYYNNSTNSGSNWGTDTRLTDNNVESLWPNIAADVLGGVHIVYQEQSEIMYLYSSNGGATWATPVNISNNPAVSMHPFIAVGTYVHVVWSDNRDGNFEIYYNRSSGPVGIQELISNVESSGLSIYPNPFREKVSIVLSAKGKEENTIGAMPLAPCLKIYDASGRLVRQWDYPTIGQSNQITWHGDDDFGQRVPGGVYFVQLNTADQKETKKVILLQ